jgi:hypothetical protein
MGVHEYGQAGDPLAGPSLPAWAAAVAAVLGSDTPVDARLAALMPGLAGIRIAAGTITTAAGAVSFPAGRFTATPIVAATANATVAVIVTTAGVSATGMTVRAFDAAGASLSTTIHWIAVQLV